MFPRIRRYSNLSLGVVVFALLLALVTLQLGQRLEGVWGNSPPHVIAPTPFQASLSSSGPAPVQSAAPQPGRAPAAPDASTAPARRASPTPRYALEVGPFLAAEAADQMEDLLNRLGYATIRFRTREVTRHYRVSLEGYDSVETAKRVVADLGRGRVVQTPGGGAHVEVTKAASLKEAVAAGRALQRQGYQPRIVSTESPTVIYHVRYGQFVSESEARTRGRELELFGIESRVVRSSGPSSPDPGSGPVSGLSESS